MTVNRAVDQEAIFVGANKQNFIADYNKKTNVVAFGASKCIALWSPTSANKQGIYCTLKRHTKDVTSVKFFENNGLLISAGEDGGINVWQQKDKLYTFLQSLELHSHSVTCIATVDETILVTGDAGGKIGLWLYTGIEWKLLHNFNVKQGFFPLCLDLVRVSENGSYLLTVGGTSSDIYVYSFTVDTTSNEFRHFSHSASLSGHEDWIKCLRSIHDYSTNSFILASGSQDRYIRLWRIKLNNQIDDSDEDDQKLVLLSNKQYKFCIENDTRIAISFEALIMGHDDWILCLQWCPAWNRQGTENMNIKLQLLSSSADTTLMIWEMDKESGIWCCITRLGEISIKGASTATGASGGFWSCLWYIDVDNRHLILTNGKTGSFRAYKETAEDQSLYEPYLAVTGPVRECTVVKWSTNGDFFFSTSLDQTTRLFAPWRLKSDAESWHEFARPQIHGYDMVCLDNISATKFVSAGDEKILRVFEMTGSIGRLLERLCKIDVLGADETEVLPDAASLPVLGLSNKANNEQLSAGDAAQRQEDLDEEEYNNEDSENVLDSIVFPPTEDYLQRYTLFPELEKLYGHGYEISCCDVSPSRALIACACKSNSAAHAAIRIFNVKKDYQLCPQALLGHNLTVTSLKFSPDGKYLLAVSRDRQFSVWKVLDEREGTFELLEMNPKAHNRIIWDCAWAPESLLGTFFFTTSRDKQIKIWSLSDSVESIGSFKLADSVTAVACFPSFLSSNKIIVAVGLESGSLVILVIDLTATDDKFTMILEFHDTITPGSRISSVDFSNKLHGLDELLLAVSSYDSSVRLYRVYLNKLI